MAVTDDEPCECADDLVPGACFPYGDGCVPYVERCDLCRVFEDDVAAAEAVADYLTKATGRPCIVRGGDVPYVDWQDHPRTDPMTFSDAERIWDRLHQARRREAERPER
jgi:hypothetical protein